MTNLDFISFPREMEGHVVYMRATPSRREIHIIQRTLPRFLPLSPLSRQSTPGKKRGFIRFAKAWPEGNRLKKMGCRIGNPVSFHFFWPKWAVRPIWPKFTRFVSVRLERKNGRLMYCPRHSLLFLMQLDALSLPAAAHVRFAFVSAAAAADAAATGRLKS